MCGVTENDSCSLEKLSQISKKTQLKIDSLQFAQYLDEIDELKHLRELFEIPSNKNNCKEKGKCTNEVKECVYLNGHLQGLCPKNLPQRFNEFLTKWQQSGEQCRRYGTLPHEYLDKSFIHQLSSLVGAKPIEVASMNSLAVNLHTLFVSFYTPTPERCTIICHQQTPTENLSAIDWHLRINGRDQKKCLVQIGNTSFDTRKGTDEIISAIQEYGDCCALVFLPGVLRTTGEVLDIKAITQAASAKGCKVGFDLSDGIGNVELHLNEWNIDFACWSTHKYLNCGPVEIGGVFIHEKYANDRQIPKLRGWWGVEFEERFQMDNDNQPCIPGALGFAISNPCVWGLTAVYASLEVFGKVSLKKLLSKQRLLTGYLEYLVHHHFLNGIEVLTPSSARASQLSMRVKNNCQLLHEHLTSNGVLCDYIAPDLLIVAPVPLYNRFADLFRFVELLIQFYR